VELVQLLNAGGIAGLGMGIIDSLVDGLLKDWLSRTSHSSVAHVQASERTRYPLQILINMVSGIGVGLLFWLSWGLAGLVRINWWERGLAFGVTLWLVCCVPYVAQLYLTHRLSARVAVVTALQRGYGLCLISLICAWTATRN
jgi:hypothetical protein